MKNNTPSFLVVYNICEINTPNLESYIERIDSLLASKYENKRICISGCRVSQKTRVTLVERYKDKVCFNFFTQRLTVQVTFNHTVVKCISLWGEFDNYVYVDSGIDIAPLNSQLDIFQEIANRYITKKYGIISIQTDTDHGHHWINANQYITDNDFIIPPGKCCHLHLTCFTKQFYQTYNKLIPDIFNAWGIETTLSVMCAATKLQWVIIKDIIAKHCKGYTSNIGYDGATAGFNPEGGLYSTYWNNLYGGIDMRQIMQDKVGKEAGFGYNCQDAAGGCYCDMTQFDLDYHVTNDKLLPFCKDKLFLKPQELNYNYIVSQFINV